MESSDYFLENFREGFRRVWKKALQMFEKGEGGFLGILKTELKKIPGNFHQFVEKKNRFSICFYFSTQIQRNPKSFQLNELEMEKFSVVQNQSES